MNDFSNKFSSVWGDNPQQLMEEYEYQAQFNIP